MSLVSGLSRLSISVASATRGAAVPRNHALAAIPSVWGARLASTKTPKAPKEDKPKRKLGPYAFFVKAHAGQTMKTYNMPFAIASKAMAYKWNSMSPDQKAVYATEQAQKPLDLLPDELTKLNP
uniref:HMG box domain-containing protein n=1 Tax=Hemiselmis tepida TaxID=464990 RepID=A0A7S0W654_9CRYP